MYLGSDPHKPSSFTMTKNPSLSLRNVELPILLLLYKCPKVRNNTHIYKGTQRPSHIGTTYNINSSLYLAGREGITYSMYKLVIKFNKHKPIGSPVQDHKLSYSDSFI